MCGLQEVINKAKEARVVGETLANAHSSRSHLVVAIKLHSQGAGAGEGGAQQQKAAVLNMVDLAGARQGLVEHLI